jgi:biotin carboxyl carrier protein
MNPFTLLQSSGEIIDKSAEMAENDPHGVIITIVSVTVVFASLIILYFAYTLIGKIASSKFVHSNEVSSGEELKPEENNSAVDDTAHDKESYVITINRNRGYLTSAPIVLQQSSTTESTTSPASAIPAKEASSGNSITAPLPGVILSIKVSVGDTVKAGQAVAVLEAMKMENDILTELDGTVRSVNVEKGESVLEGAIIITIG